MTGGSGVPAHQRLSEGLRSGLMSGRFAQNEKLPTEAELAREFGISRQTVRRAFQDLVSEGLVYRVPGRGTFPGRFLRRGHYVRSIGAVEDLQAFAATEMEILRPMELVRDEVAAAKLGLDSKVVASLALRRLYEGVPFGFTRISLPPKLGQRLVEEGILPERGDGTVIGALEGFVSGGVEVVDQDVTTAPIPPEAAAHIGCEPGQHGLMTERIYFDAHNNPVELAVSHYNPDRYTYRIQLQRRTR